MIARIWNAYGAELLIWLALMALLALTCASAYIDLGAGNLILNMAIATVMAILAALFFMQLRSEQAIMQLAAAAGLLWLCFLFVLTFADVLTRMIPTP